MVVRVILVTILVILLPMAFFAEASDGGSMPRENRPLFERFGACAALLGHSGNGPRAEKLLRMGFEVARASSDGDESVFLAGVTYGAALLGMNKLEVNPKDIFLQYECSDLVGAGA